MGLAGFGAGLVGIVASIVIVFVTQYYTECRYRPVKTSPKLPRPARLPISSCGMSVGFETTLPPLLSSASLCCCPTGSARRAAWPGAGAFGTAVATMGMLMTCPYVLTMDTFGPITDNANGINELAGAGPEVSKITDRLDAVGNTTKALTKGYAMVSAGLAAFLLFQAYLDSVYLCTAARASPMTVRQISPGSRSSSAPCWPPCLSTCSARWAIKAVGKTAGKIIEEVRRQFRADPEILNPKDPAKPHKPDYAKAVDITASAALREMIAPGLLPVLAPVVIGVTFRSSRGEL